MALTRFTLTEVLKALQERLQFTLAQVRLEETPDGYRVTVPQDTWLATTPGGRKDLERDSVGWRWAAGGGLVILECTDQEVALVRHRDSGAPSYPDHWTLGSGLSSSVDEFSNPERLAVREATEEFVIATPKGVLIPTFGDEMLDAASFGAVGSSRDIRHGYAGLFATQQYLEAPGTLAELPGEKNIHVALEGVEGERQYRGLVVVDKNTRGIDFLKAIRIRIPFTFAEIAILDGEADKEGRSLDAPVGCLPIKDGMVGSRFIAVFQHAERQDPGLFEFRNQTPVLRAFVSVMK